MTSEITLLALTVGGAGVTAALIWLSGIGGPW